MPTPFAIDIPTHEDGAGWLSVYESGQRVPFDIKRVFVVGAPPGMTGGNHAHKRCTQLLVCVHGTIRVTCDDGVSKTEYTLDSSRSGLLLRPGTWATEEYVSDGATLMVLCDRGYEIDDYIRDYDEFQRFCRANRESGQ